MSKDCKHFQGGVAANDVFKVVKMNDPDFEHKGCWNDQDGERRVFSKYWKDPWGMTPTKCFEIIQRSGEDYTIFGVQVRIDLDFANDLRLTK